MRFEDQAEFHVREYLLALGAGLTEVYERSHAVDVDVDERCAVKTPGGRVTADRVVVATHYPFLDRALAFPRVHPQRSYALLCSIDGEPPPGMYISGDSPTRSIRAVPVGGEEKLLVGGEGHRPGEGGDTEERYAALEAFAREHWAVRSVDYRWSSQDNTTVDTVPYVGRMTPLTDKLLMATGFAKWGMTGGTAAALVLADALLGRENPWASLFDPNRFKPRAAAPASSRRTPGSGCTSSATASSTAARARSRSSQPGEGDIVRHAGEKVAGHRRDDGTLVAVSPTVHPPRLPGQLEHRGAQLGLPVPRLALQPRRRRPPGPRRAPPRSTSPSSSSADRVRPLPMLKLRGTRIAAALTCAAALFAGCGDDSSDSSRRRRCHRRAEDHRQQGHRPRLDGRRQGRDVSFCTGKDTSGSKTAGVKAFNKANPGITVKLIEFPESADEQRNQFVQRQEAKSADCDVFYSDVIWTAEFAQQKWLYDMTPYVESRKDEFIPSTFETITYQDKTWGVPHKTNAGFLYYRTDQVDKAPDDLAGGLRRRRQEGRHRLPGRVVRGPHRRLPRARVRGRRQGALRGRHEGRDRLAREPQGAQVHGRRHQERRGAEGRDDLHGGARAASVRVGPRDVHAQLALLLRARPEGADATKGKFAVAPLPEFEGGGKAGILGGANLVISTYSKNPGAALKFIDYMTHEERQSRGHREVLRRVAAEERLRGPGGAEGAAVLRRAQEGGRAGQVAARLAGLSADLGGDLQERQPGAVGRDEPRGGAEEGADRHGEGAEDVLMPDELVVFDRGVPLGFTFRDLMSYHGPGSPGGVAHGFKVMERALPLLEPAGPPERREIEVATAFGGPGARDAFELVTARGDGRSLHGRLRRSRCPSAGGRASASCSACLPRRARWRSGVREGFVTEEFLTLARTGGSGAGADGAARRAQARDGRARDGGPASEVYEPVSLTRCPDTLFSSSSPVC